MTPREAYEELLSRLRTASLLSSTKSLLEWDEETQMPEGGVLHRSQQIALLAGRIHEELVHPRVSDLIGLASKSELTRDARSAEAVNLRRWTRRTERNCRLDRGLVEESAAAVTLSQHAWVAARKANDFSAFLPHLSRVITLKRREASALSAGTGEPWNAMLEEFEPGMTAARLEQVFEPIRPRLRDLLDRVAGSSHRPRTDVLRRRVDAATQKKFAMLVIERLGFDFTRGRLDTSAHPFSTHLGPGDVRLTTRFFEDDITEGLFGALHEAGHGLYDQGLPQEHFGTPRGDAASYGMHESQSRLWENFVGRGAGFWRCFYPELRRVCPGVFDDVDEDAFVFAINEVEPGLNRVRADEVTYNLHVFIRFRLERALLSGDLTPRDLPGAWREAYETDLGVSPTDDADGCLQDGHWAAGLFGYFPTYALGNVIAGQLAAAAERDIGSLDAAIAAGRSASLLDWLRAKVHGFGQSLEAEDLVREATGQGLATDPLLDALERKYAALYRLR